MLTHSAQLGYGTSAPAMTRPNNTTAYSSGQLVANNVSGANVVPLAFPIAQTKCLGFQIWRGRLSKTGTSVTNAAFRIHLFNAVPTITAGGSNGDGATFTSVASGAANYLGYLDVTAMQGFADGCTGIGSPGVGSEITAAVPGTNMIYGLIEVRGAYTPVANEVFTATLEVTQN